MSNYRVSNFLYCLFSHSSTIFNTNFLFLVSFLKVLPCYKRRAERREDRHQMTRLIPRIVRYVDRLSENDTSAKLDLLLAKFETWENFQTQLNSQVPGEARPTAACTSHMSSTNSAANTSHISSTTKAAANTNLGAAYTPRKNILPSPSSLLPVLHSRFYSLLAEYSIPSQNHAPRNEGCSPHSNPL